VPVLTAACASIPIARRSEIFCCASGILQFPDVDLTTLPRAGGSIREARYGLGSARDMPAAGFVRQVLEQFAGGLPDPVTLRAAVVGGIPRRRPAARG
jgi:hypothetical protein